MHSTPTATLKVILMLPPLGIYIKGEARQATDRLNCFREFPRAIFGHSQDMSEILPSDGVIFYTDGSLCEGSAGAGVFSDTLDIREFHALGSLCNSRLF
jgi:hypothetical protein